MVTDLRKPTTLAQFRAALAESDTARQLLVKECDQLRQALNDSEQRNEQAARQLVQAEAMLGQFRLAATAAADRELTLRRELDQLAQRLAASPSAPAALTEPDEIARLQQQIDGLVEDNRRMAQEQEQSARALSGAEAMLQEQKTTLAKAVAEALERGTAELRRQLGRQDEELKLARERLGAQAAQLKATGRLEVVAPEQVGAMMDRFLQRIGQGLPALQLAEGELKLKLGVGSQGHVPGFVILPPEASPELKQTLQEISLRYDRRGLLDTDPGLSAEK